ncbi:Para-aminobenzoate synthase, aminase component [Chondromyces apiculatus DSM 436]|uniref:Para-aminobenzoate synthase, aminase component n=1 Tax=Chondromyces apiculatus DSM 436 TaxID=1192034 RepID=A0A017T5Q4_9BACT|nr:Para-aminobenzoate synthase, aminase component [Chondromyces apiculatus DSM 436]
MIRTFPSDHVTPLRAYASLRARSPERPSFIFEWGGGRYAAVGYRPRSETLYPNGKDTLATLRQDMGEIHAAAQSELSPSEFAASTSRDLAAALCLSLIGFVTYEALQQSLGLEPWGEMALLSRFMKGPTVVVFDQQARTMTIAGTSDGAVRRCAWELAQDPNLSPLPLPDMAALPEFLSTAPIDSVFAAKTAAARTRIAAGEVNQLLLARTFKVPPRNADLLDAYRALRILSPQSHLFFIEFTETPFAPAMTLFGAAEDLFEKHPTAAPAAETSTDVAATINELEATLHAGARVGTPTAAAARLARTLEAGPRMLHGGAAGYLLPGGGASLALGRASALLYRGEISLSGTGDVTAEGSAGEACQRDAQPVLASLRAAQDALRAREAEVERKREATRAAEEKAKAEQLAAQADAAADQGSKPESDA